jgi:hypothetical protein
LYHHQKFTTYTNCYLCAEYDQAFITLIPHCFALNAYGVRVKYPDEIEVDERKANQAISDAQTVLMFNPIVTIRAEIENEYAKDVLVTHAQVTKINDPEKSDQTRTPLDESEKVECDSDECSPEFSLNGPSRSAGLEI